MPDSKPGAPSRKWFHSEKLLSGTAAFDIINHAIVELQKDNVELGQD